LHEVEHENQVLSQKVLFSIDSIQNDCIGNEIELLIGKGYPEFMSHDDKLGKESDSFKFGNSKE